MPFFDQLGRMLGQQPQQQPSGAQQSGVNYGDVLKTLGMSGMSSKDQADMKDANDISQLLALFGGGVGAAAGGGAMAGASTGLSGASFGSNLLQ